MKICFCTNPVITAIGVDGVEFWDEDDDLWVRNEAVLKDRPSSSQGVCCPEDEADNRHSSLTLSLVRICSSIWIFNILWYDVDGNTELYNYALHKRGHPLMLHWEMAMIALPIIIDTN